MVSKELVAHTLIIGNSSGDSRLVQKHSGNTLGHYCSGVRAVQTSMVVVLVLSS